MMWRKLSASAFIREKIRAAKRRFVPNRRARLRTTFRTWNDSFTSSFQSQAGKGVYARMELWARAFTRGKLIMPMIPRSARFLIVDLKSDSHTSTIVLS